MVGGLSQVAGNGTEGGIGRASWLLFLEVNGLDGRRRVENSQFGLCIACKQLEFQGLLVIFVLDRERERIPLYLRVEDGLGHVIGGLGRLLLDKFPIAVDVDLTGEHGAGDIVGGGFELDGADDLVFELGLPQAGKTFLRPGILGSGDSRAVTASRKTKSGSLRMASAVQVECQLGRRESITLSADRLWRYRDRCEVNVTKKPPGLLVRGG